MVCNTSRFRVCSIFDSAVLAFLLQQQWITENKITDFEMKIQKAVNFAETRIWETLNQLTKFVYSNNL